MEERGFVTFRAAEMGDLINRLFGIYFFQANHEKDILIMFVSLRVRSLEEMDECLKKKKKYSAVSSGNVHVKLKVPILE